MNTHPFNRMIDEMGGDAEIRYTAEDVANLRVLVQTIERAESARLGDLLSYHAGLQLLADYYYRRMQYFALSYEERVDTLYYQLVASVKTSGGESKISDKAAEARAKSDPQFTTSRARSAKLAYYAHLLGDLHSAYLVRGRMLEQLSNNDRVARREEKEV